MEIFKFYPRAELREKESIWHLLINECGRDGNIYIYGELLGIFKLVDC